ncbi:MAG TPA: T9SS type A sorting domain-containing protein [Ignavibacteria bacterium]|nr:T9SS type A sorting domain-containing protein [Ignavibacteria bacterium]
MKLKILIIFFLLIAFEVNANSSRDAAGLWENFRIYPSSVTQTETFITSSPINPNLLFVACNTINLSNGFVSEGIYVSTNGGVNWTGSDTCTGPPIGFHKGDPGIAIDKNGTFVMTRLGFLPGLYSHFSTDNGVTWSPQRTIITSDQDRATTASDHNPTSPFYGRVYTSWIKFEPPYPLFFAYTDNGASTWSSPAQVNNPVQRGQGGDVAIGPNGEVYLTWANVTSESPFTEDKVGFSRSTNGGASWINLEQAYDMNGIQGVLPQKNNIRVNGLPNIAIDNSNSPRRGWIYIVTGEKNLLPAGTDPDIVLHRSTDGGATWSAGVRVNQDPINNGKIQYFPAIEVDDNGGVNIIYYDDRNVASNAAQVYLSRSQDGGVTFRDYQVSDHSFIPTPIGGLGQGYQGDNIDLTSIGNILQPVWMDNSSGIYQLWTCRIDLNTISVNQISSLVPEKFILQQNYPNPFNPETKIRFSIPFKSNVELKVYDIKGVEVGNLSNGEFVAGEYEYSFNAAGLPSGIYFYTLKTDRFSETKKMTLIK